MFNLLRKKDSCSNDWTLSLFRSASGEVKSALTDSSSHAASSIPRISHGLCRAERLFRRLCLLRAERHVGPTEGKHSLGEPCSVLVKALETVLRRLHHVGVGKYLPYERSATVIQDGCLLIRRHLQTFMKRAVGGDFGLIRVLITDCLFISSQEFLHDSFSIYFWRAFSHVVHL